MRSGFLRTLLRAAPGSTAVEFALVLAPLLGLTFGIIEYARFFWTQEALEQTAIATARCMGIPQSNCATSGAYSTSKTQTFITNTSNTWGISVPTGNMTLNNSASCAGTSGFSQVTLTSTFVTAVPGILPLPSGGNTLTATACFPNNS